MLLLIIACLVTAPRGAAAEAMPIDERIAANRAESVACVRHYEERIRAGEDLRMEPGMTSRERSGMLTARANLARFLYDTNRSGGYDREEWLEKSWRFELLFDLDRDQQVTLDEYMQGRARSGPSRSADMEEFRSNIRRSDRDRFNRLTRRGPFLQRQHLARESAMTFRAHDLDRDEEVTSEDMQRVSRGELRRWF